MALNTPIEALLQLANEDSSEKRRELLRAVTDLFMSTETVNEEQSQLFDDVMTRVADDAGTEGRRELSSRIAPVGHAPRGIINKLARDDEIDVAAPVLTESPVLSDDDLVQITETKSQDHLAAVSERKEIATRVTDVLIEHGNSKVLRNVSGNTGAMLSDTGARTLSAKADDDNTIQRNLFRRDDLPPEVALEVQARGDVPEEETGDPNPNTPQGWMIPTIVQEFSKLSGLEPDRVEKMILEERLDIVVIICKSLELTGPEFEKVLRQRTLHTGPQEYDLNSLMLQYNTLPPHAAQRMARFLKVRQTVG